MIDPNTGAVEWTTLLVAGTRSPGVCKLGGPGLQLKWDVKDADGQQGASSDLSSEPIKEFEADFYLTDEADDLNVTDFDRWDEFEALLRSSINGEKPVALEMYHPDLARVGITAAALKSIGMASLDGMGGATIKVSFIEFRPPKPKKAAGVAKTKAQPKTEGDKKIDEASAEIKKLQEEWKTL